MAGYVNQRAKKIWKQVLKKQKFQKKTVIDIGCGPGDFMRLALGAGAKHVYGVDSDFVMAIEAWSQLKAAGFTSDQVSISSGSIEDMMARENAMIFDVAICFSALPYFKSMEDVLKWMMNNSVVSLIECQYYGDGPGPANISDDGDMKDLLEKTGWDKVEKIGETDVVIRPAKRSIWRCE